MTGVIVACDAERKSSSEVHGGRAGKSRYSVYGTRTKTDTGGQGENPKADGRSIVKELGKKAP